jgi:hypothetical protein
MTSGSTYQICTDRNIILFSHFILTTLKAPHSTALAIPQMATERGSSLAYPWTKRTHSFGLLAPLAQSASTSIWHVGKWVICAGHPASKAAGSARTLCPVYNALRRLWRHYVGHNGTKIRCAKLNPVGRYKSRGRGSFMVSCLHHRPRRGPAAKEGAPSPLITVTTLLIEE